MSNWASFVSEMDDALMDTFSEEVILHFFGGDKQVKGIFENPYSLSTLPNGGDIRDSEPELFLKDEVAKEIERDLFITVSGQKWLVVKMPEPDGTGLTKLILGHTDGQQKARPTVRYRS